jgi:hypothetical protein
MVGATVFTGGEGDAVTTALWAELAALEPAVLVPVTLATMVWPTSAAASV